MRLWFWKQNPTDWCLPCLSMVLSSPLDPFQEKCIVAPVGATVRGYLYALNHRDQISQLVVCPSNGIRRGGDRHAIFHVAVFGSQLLGTTYIVNLHTDFREFV